MSEMPAAVILLSGGLDSAVVLGCAVRDGYRVHAISFDYGQRHKWELDFAAEVARHGGAVDHRVITLDGSAFSGSALTDDIEVPKDRSLSDAGIPITYVPARNIVFLSMATAFAESLSASDLFIGVNAVDYSGYPDCRPEFIASFEHAMALGTRAGVTEGERPWRIHAPLQNLSKGDIVRLGVEVGVNFGITLSCYDPGEIDGTIQACRHCDACRLRAAGFAEAGVIDAGLEMILPAT
ncbi:MAG: 7-cyano-7-deazaguanine synthase QueC [Phycisphaerales bacterium]|nr:7-cyano-7-deazaguanine synthase QueC [Phycisphaerales bacterium]